MTITIVGLGLMGGSLALALRGFEGASLRGVDIDPAAREAVIQSGAVDAVYDALPESSDVIIACLPPEATLSLLRDSAEKFVPGSLFCEFCGVKRGLVPQITALLPPGVDYIPLHPMAGREAGGRADARLFAGAGLIVTPPDGKRPRRASLIERTARYIGFSEVVYTTPEAHDAMIAYTSHLPHLAASALCLDMPEGLSAAYTGGSFRDGTRVANLDTALWASLLLENRDNNQREIARLQSALDALHGALEADDRDALIALLTKAKMNKQRL